MTDLPNPGSPSSPRESQWRRVNELFHLALDRPEAERASFLDEACGSDTTLRGEVQSLLDAHRGADEFLEAPAAAAAEVIGTFAPGEQSPTPLKIYQYRIDGVIGRGGMGVVYLAYDTKLLRKVALKAISPEYVHDASRRERLRREGRAAANLKHPGIATVYALEEFGDDVFIATEYIDGETLREEIRRGPIAPGKALETAIALANALGAAHAGGVIHRDLKPENVMRPVEGGLKILDFGLAQMPESEDAARLTVDGRVIGTPAYMAPEQIRGDRCDARTDLFSFGIVMFELLTGTHPFGGADSNSTIARILESDPGYPVAAARDGDSRLVGGLWTIIRTCLAKKPEARFPSAHALLAALELVRGGSSPSEPARPESALTAMRWWQFHQAAACVCYAVLMLPLWLTRAYIDERWGRRLFVAGLIATVAASVVRLHLLFASSSLPEEWRAQREQSHPWLRFAEVALVAVLAGAGFWVLERQAALGATLVSAAVVVFLSFTLIEPATTRAAFRR
jgi:tRNA A-37 threonylcarbamoyl transferase component Bud32